MLVWRKSGGKCFYCGEQTVPFGRYDFSFCVDHLHPVSRGGSDNIDNLIPCCMICNSRRGDCMFVEWICEKRIFGIGIWGFENGFTWEEIENGAKTDPLYMTIKEFMERTE